MSDADVVRGASSESTVPEAHARLASRPNIVWWQAHGGDEWLREVERRRPGEPRYGRQEAWLAEHFRHTPPLRVLDFGCGYGRHLRNMRSLPQLDLYGCDMSATMFAKIGEYVGDEAWAREKTRLIAPLGRIPFEDGFFDVTYVSEVLIHVNPDDLPDVLREIIRVTLQRLVLIENKRTDESRFGTPAHDGCWLHDLAGALRRLGFGETRILEDVLADQDVYLVDLLRGASSPERQRLGEAMAVRDGELVRRGQRLEEIERQRARLESELNEAIRDRIVGDAERIRCQRLLADTASQLEAIENSMVRRVIRKAKRYDRSYRAVRGLALGAVNVLRSGSVRKAPEPVLPGGPRGTLRFGGFAEMAKPETPEAFLRAQPRVVGICHPAWRGIRAATYSLCDAVLEVPAVVDAAHADAIGSFLAQAGAEVVVIQGIPPGSQRLAVSLRRQHPRLRLLHVFHGSSAQHTILRDEAELLDDMLELARCGVLDGVGFVKSGMAVALRGCGYPTYALFNKVRPVDPPPGPHALHESGLHIGVFVPDLWVKNINTQVLAALALPGTTVHVTEAPPARYLKRFERRVVVEGMLKHGEFLRRMGEMDANLYVSLSECYPMTVLESLERGVPCLTSHTSPIFDDEPYLFERLVVTRHDDAGAIARQLETALREREQIVERGHAHLRQLNARADELWAKFTNG